MGRKLPPLNALRAFEIASQATSFTAAAGELCVSQGAVSRHIAHLEDYFGVPLFDRGGRNDLIVTRAIKAIARSATANQSCPIARPVTSRKPVANGPIHQGKQVVGHCDIEVATTAGAISLH